MKIANVVSGVVLGALAAFLALPAAAQDWVKYEAPSYGFEMLIPKGVKTAEREYGGGWGGLNATFEGVKLFGLAKLGAGESDAAIEKFAIQTIGIPASAWTEIDKGANKNGWSRYRVFQARSGTKLVFGGYGVGPRGNYLLYLETTPDDFRDHRADYDRWYNSITLR
jgi:hypothetical protein